MDSNLIGSKTIVTREKAIDFYRHTILGARIVETMPRYALSGTREITIKDAPLEVTERFEELHRYYKVDDKIMLTLIYSRIFGLSALYLALENKQDPKMDTRDIIPTYKDIDLYDFSFNALDPSPLSGSQIDMEYNSTQFMDVIPNVLGKHVPKNRIEVSTCKKIIYMNNNGVGIIAWSPPSIFENIAGLIQIYEDTLNNIGKIINKVGAIIYKNKDISKSTSVKFSALQRVKEIITRLKSGEVITIDKDSEITDLNSGNFTGLIDLIGKLKDAIAEGVTDTKKNLLFDENVSTGLSDGSEDQKSIYMSIDEYRENKVTPLYNFTDRYILSKTLDANFLIGLKNKYPEWRDTTVEEMQHKFYTGFQFEYSNLQPESKKEMLMNKALFLDNVIKLQTLGTTTADLEDIINTEDILTNEVSLEEILDDMATGETNKSLDGSNSNYAKYL